jgi:hypothetical protein
MVASLSDCRSLALNLMQKWRAVKSSNHGPAWAVLLRRQPERDAVFAWLRVVAVHEAYRLSAIDRRDARLERLRLEDGDWQEVIADLRSLDDAVESLEALRGWRPYPSADAMISRPRSRATPTRRSARKRPDAHAPT